jgi:hypothetical protein
MSEMTNRLAPRWATLRLAIVVALGLAATIGAATAARAEEVWRSYEWHNGRQVLVERHYPTPPPVVYEAPPAVVYDPPPVTYVPPPPRVVYQTPPVTTYVQPAPPPVTYIPPPPVTVITR